MTDAHQLERQEARESEQWGEGFHSSLDPSQLSLIRTVLSTDRTLMSWIRTSVSLIGFGFTIFQFFESLRESQGLPRPESPKHLGLTLIAVGVVALVLAVVQHQRILRRIGLGTLKAHMTTSVAVALVLALIGVVAFFSIYFNTGPF